MGLSYYLHFYSAHYTITKKVVDSLTRYLQKQSSDSQEEDTRVVFVVPCKGSFFVVGYNHAFFFRLS